MDGLRGKGTMMLCAGLELQSVCWEWEPAGIEFCRLKGRAGVRGERGSWELMAEVWLRRVEYGGA